ncbi:MAG: hypothetical protein ABI629_10895 [bacterium]
MSHNTAPRRPSHRTPAARRWLGVALVCTLLGGGTGQAANTEPTLALISASAVRGSGGRATVTLEGSFSFDDAVQLDLPLDIVITQGTRSAHCDLAGNIAVSLDGGAPQAAAPPAVIGISERRITLVLPASFGSGEATAQVVMTYEGKRIASNQLRFTL